MIINQEKLIVEQLLVLIKKILIITVMVKIGFKKIERFTKTKTKKTIILISVFSY